MVPVPPTPGEERAASAVEAAAPPAPISEQEVEIWWGGYAGRTMLPAFTLCGLLTISILLIAHLVWQEESLTDAVISHFAMYLIVALWAAVVSRWAYLTVTIGYRLTTRQLLVEMGFAHPARPAIPLEHIHAVRVEQNPWERWVGVGRLRLETDNGRVEVLPGILTPAAVAAEVLRQVEARKTAALPH